MASSAGPGQGVDGYLDADRIAAAVQCIDPVFLDTAVVRHADLDAALGAHVLAKVETRNPIRCFKGRGTDHYLRHLPSGTARIVAASAGNFGQALAYCSRERDLAVTIFAAATASPAKLEAIRRLGAQVELVDGDFDDAKLAAREQAERTGDLFAEDSADPLYAEGAGTIGVELTAQAEGVDVVLAPLGNGALAAGIGAWMRQASPTTRVIGVVAETAPAMKLSFARGSAVETATADTIADGVATRVPVAFGLASCLRVLDEVISVSDEAIIAGMRLLHTSLGIAVEPSAALGAAALATHPDFAGARAAIILCGANLTPAQHRRWLGAG